MAIVYAVINGYLDDYPVSRVHEFEQKLFEKLESDYSYFIERIEQNQFEEYDVETLKKALEETKGNM